MSCDNKVLREIKRKAGKEIKRLIGLRHKFSWHEGKAEAQMRLAVQESIQAQIRLIRLINLVLSENIIEFND